MKDYLLSSHLPEIELFYWISYYLFTDFFSTFKLRTYYVTLTEIGFVDAMMSKHH